MMKKIKIGEGIFILIFKTQKDLTSTFLRFQEHYESPKFRGQVFTIDEYKKWYKKVRGRFSYYTDWNGFNIPSKVLNPFYDGKFNPLSVKEKKLLNLFKDEKGKFYIIGVHLNDGEVYALCHELAHALFYINKKYRGEMLALEKKYKFDKIAESFVKTGGYHKSVFEDEFQAYAVEHGYKSHKRLLPRKFTKEAKKIFEKYRKNLKRENS